MTATTITTGIVVYQGKQYWCMTSCFNRIRLLYLVPKTSDRRPEFCVDGEWIPASEVAEWISREGGKTVNVF